MKERVLYASLDFALFGLLQDAAARELLRQTLLSDYFPHTSSSQAGYFAEVEA